MEVDRNDNDDDDDDDDASDDIAARRGGVSGSRAPAKKTTKTTTAAANKAASTTAKKAPATKRGAKKAAVPLVSRLEATNALPKSSAHLILIPPPRLLQVRRRVRRRRGRRGRSGRFRRSRVCFPTYSEEACCANDAGYERKEGAGRFDFESRGGETESIVVCLESRVAARDHGRRILMEADHLWLHSSLSGLVRVVADLRDEQQRRMLVP